MKAHSACDMAASGMAASVAAMDKIWFGLASPKLAISFPPQVLARKARPPRNGRASARRRVEERCGALVVVEGGVIEEDSNASGKGKGTAGRDEWGCEVRPWGLAGCGRDRHGADLVLLRHLRSWLPDSLRLRLTGYEAFPGRGNGCTTRVLGLNGCPRKPLPLQGALCGLPHTGSHRLMPVPVVGCRA